MRKPNESLDEYSVTPASKISSEPPRAVSLRQTGEVEVLKPITLPEVRTNAARTGFKMLRPAVSPQPLWFRRFLAVGSGALVMIGLVLVSAILVGINDPAAGPDVATNGQPGDMLTQTEEPFGFHIYSPLGFARVSVGNDIVRSNVVRRRSARPAIRLTAYRPKVQLRLPPQPEEPKFVPTTLIIYAENGVINTRIEPWLQDTDNKKATFSN